jgi:5-formyltetrahydrofolate cyclo-ligase
MAGEAKEVLRREIKGRLDALVPEQFYREGVKAAAHIPASFFWSRYQSVLLFLSTRRELDTQPLLNAAFSDHKKVFIPKIEKGRIRFCRLNSPAGPWQYGAFHIREPAWTDQELFKAGDDPALIIVPGLAFDRTGTRLGHGGGYYDRFFAELDKEGVSYSTIGLCLECQVVPRLPREVWDKEMNVLCTGGGLTALKPAVETA